MTRPIITHSRRRSPQVTFIIALVVIFFLIVFQNPLRQIAFSMIGSLSLVRETPYALIPHKTLASRLEKAEKELSRIRFESVLYEQAIAENAEMKEFLNIVGEEPYTVAMVIATPPRTHYDSLILSVSDASQIKENDKALYSQVFLGSVQSIAGNVVTVALLSSPGNTIDARVGEPSAIVILNGEGGGSFSFTVPRDVVISAGDIVRTAGGDYIIGVVSSEQSTPDNTQKKVLVHVPLSFSELRFVELLHSPIF